MLSGLGGLLGASLGLVAAWLVKQLTPFPSIVEPYSVVLALGFSGAVGIFFGFYPAFATPRSTQLSHFGTSEERDVRCVRWWRRNR